MTESGADTEFSVYLQVTYTCATQVNALTPIIQYNGEKMGHLYGTRGYRGLPTLSKLREIKSDCDCFHHGNNCEGPSGWVVL